MLRFDIRDNVEIKIQLYKNRHEIIDEIPLEYINNIKYTFNDIDTMDITIPQYVSSNGEKRFNRLYRKIKTRQIIVVTTKNKNGDIKQQKFTLANKKMYSSLNKGNKQFTAYSWEKTLERQRITVDALARQLTNKNDTVQTGEGILDLICKKTGWKVGYVDPDARSKVSLAVQSFTNNIFPSLSINKVTNGLLLFDKNVSITVPTDKPLYLTFHYTDVKVYDSSNNLLSTMNIENDITTEPLYTSVKNIKAYHYSEAGNRYGIRYLITMTDNVQVERICTFTNCIDKKLTTGTINLAYDFGDVVEQSNIQYANFEAFDDSALKFLQDIQDIFECVFEYDTMTNTINTYAYKNLNKNSGYPLTLGENVVEINTTEDESIPTMLKVDSDKTSIIEHNPNGTMFVENYDYYIKNDLMSSSLKNALIEFDRISASLLEQWNVLKSSKTLLQQKYTKAQSELQSLTERIKNLTNLLSSLFNADANRQLEVKTEVEQLEVRVAHLMSIMNTYLDELKTVETQISTINSKTQKVNMVNEQGVKVFNSDDLDELSDMMEAIQLTDSYYTTPYGLYGYAKRYLEDKANPKITFDLKCVDLVNLIQNPRGWNNILELGTLFPLEENEILNEKEIRLTELELVPIKGTDRVKCNNLKFSNKINENSRVKVGANIGKTTNKVSGVMATYSQLWENIGVTDDFVRKMREQGLDVASANIRGGVYRNSYDMTEAGLFIRSVVDGNTDNQIYIGGGMICITDTNWRSSKLAIDKNGILADSIVGRLILGEKLIISDEGNTFYIGASDNFATDKEFGLSIYDETTMQRRVFLGLAKEPSTGIRKAMLRLVGKNGELALTEDGIASVNQLCDETDLDNTHPITIDYYVDEGVQTIKKATLKLRCKKFRSTTRGGKLVSKVSIVPSGGGSTSGGGGGMSTSNGGGGTSSANGGHNHTICQDLGNVSGAFYDSVVNIGGCWIQGRISNLSGQTYFSSDGVDSHYHYTDSHRHNTDYHYHSYPSHTHPDIDFSHQHEEIWGITEKETASNLVITVNGTKVVQGLNGTAEVDVTNYLIKGQWNEIKIESFTNGRVSWNLFTKSFNLF